MNQAQRTAEAEESMALLARDLEGYVGSEFWNREDAWECVRPAWIDYLLALSIWEHDGTEEARVRRDRTIRDLWSAWGKAVFTLTEGGRLTREREA